MGLDSLRSTTLSNASSKSFWFSDAPTSRAVSRKRLWRSASESLGRRFGAGFWDIFMIIPESEALAHGNS